MLSVFLILLSFATQAEPVRPSPLRRAVDVYNALGSASRLIAFMKIGATPDDLRYLNGLAARADHSPLPKAYLAGGVIYFRGLAEPLKVIDLRSQRFSIRGRSFDLNGKPKLESLLRGPEPLVYTGALALSGLASSLQCYEDARSSQCGGRFMGMLAALGEVGGFSGPAAPSQAFCTPDFHGRSKLVVSATRHKLMEVSESAGEYRIDPGPAEPTAGEQRAAATLLEACNSKSAIENYNVAFAYPVHATQDRGPRGLATSYTPPVRAPRDRVNSHNGDATDAAQ